MFDKKTTPAVESLSNSNTFLGNDSSQQRGAIHNILWYGILITMSYVFLYLLMSFYLLAAFNTIICILYSILFLLNDREPKYVRVLGIAFMIVASIQIVSLSTLFISPSTGLHLWLLVIPFFCIITIDRKDIGWALIISAISTLTLTWLEWNKDTYVPPLEVTFPYVLLPAIRAFSILIIISFVAGIFGYYYQRLTLARQEIQLSYERSERLLLNILPASIASRLKAGSSTIADDISEASVLFCDLVGFTTIASKQTAHETVDMLNGVFTAFDEAIEARGLEKIKTIGDAYMVASGVPNPRPDHAKQLIYLARDLFEILEEYNKTHHYNLSLRIGINSGPVTAGVIGSRKFSYDLWGDTVNVASRMESTGIPNHIQVTQTVVDATKHFFHFEERDAITVKGKGSMQTFLWVDEL